MILNFRSTHKPPLQKREESEIKTHYKNLKSCFFLLILYKIFDINNNYNHEQLWKNF